MAAVKDWISLAEILSRICSRLVADRLTAEATLNLAEALSLFLQLFFYGVDE
jgi:hypothetical protein